MEKNLNFNRTLKTKKPIDLHYWLLFYYALLLIKQ